MNLQKTLCFFTVTYYCSLQNVNKMRAKACDILGAKKTILAAQLGAVLATVRTYETFIHYRNYETTVVSNRKSLVFQIDHPALAITGVNNQQELSSVVLDIGIISVWYFLVMPVSLRTHTLYFQRFRWFMIMSVELIYYTMVCVSQSSWTG